MNSKGYASFVISVVAVVVLAWTLPVNAVTVVTDGGTVEWVTYSSYINEVRLTAPVYHGDGYDGAMMVSVSGALQYNNSYHFSTNYAVAVQNVGVLNNTDSAQTYTIDTYGNLGSDSGTRWHYTSAVAPYYTISSDNANPEQDGGDPVISFLFGDDSVDQHGTSRSLTYSGDNYNYTIYNVTIPAGETHRYLFIGGAGNIDDTAGNRPSRAYEAVQFLTDAQNWPDDLTSFLTPAEMNEVVNWSFNNLNVFPEEDYIVNAYLGYPIDPSSKVYTVSNSSTSLINWSAASSSSWVDMAPAGGILIPGGTSDITVMINTNASGLAAGDHTATLTFNNITSGNSQVRDVHLRITPPPPPPQIPFNPSPAHLAANVPIEGMLSWNDHSATSPAIIPSQDVHIDFDDTPAPDMFIDTVRLTDAYADLGVVFEGPGGLDGGAIVTDRGGWPITGHSAPNFLAFNTTAALADGGIPRGPETLTFSPPVSSVRMLVGSSSGQTLWVEAYNQADALVDSSSVSLTRFTQEASVTGSGIVRVVISGGSTLLIVDDLIFDQEENVGTYDVFMGTNAASMMQIGANLTNAAIDPGLLDIDTTYYWQVVASNIVGVTTGAVWQFTTWSSGPVDHFTWESIPDQQYVHTPINVRIEANDVHGYPVESFTGTAQLSGGKSEPIGFDNLLEDSVPSGYQGLTWNNFYCINGGNYWTDSGYVAGTVSPDNCVLNNFANAASISSAEPMSLISGYLTAAWNDNLQVQVQGYNGPTLLYDNTYTLSATTPTLINFDYIGVTQVVFSSSGGTPHPGYNGGGTHFAMDNVSIEGVGSDSVLISPTNTGNFVDGVWSGPIMIQEPATNMYLMADDGAGHTGKSLKFDVDYVGIFSISLPASAMETDGVLSFAGQVHVTPPPEADLVVNLISDDASELTVPSTVIIPAGATNAVFSPIVHDDTELDVTQVATVTASAAGYLTGSRSIAIHDNESAMLAIDIPPTILEGDVVLPDYGRVYADAAPSVDVEVALSLSQNSDLALPSVTTTLPAGETNALFSLQVLDNRAIDGPRKVIIGAAVNGWISGTNEVTVLDDENKNLTVRLPAAVVEDDDVLADVGEVFLSGTWPSNVYVSLSSDNISELMAAGSVVISAGETNAFFDLTVMDDTVLDGPQTVTISASAAAFSGTNASVIVQDNEAEIRGFKWLDYNTNSLWDAGEPGLENWTIFSDLNGNGIFDEEDPFDVTDASGFYAISVTSGLHRVGEVIFDNWMQAYPAGIGNTVNSNTLVELGNVYSPNVLEFTFTNLPPATGDATLTVFAIADLGSSSEYLTLEAESHALTNLFAVGGGENVGRSIDVPIEQSLLADWLDDGAVSFSVTPSRSVGNFGGSELRLTLHYPAADGMHAIDVGYGEVTTNINFGNMITGLYFNVVLPDTAVEGDGVVSGELQLNYPAFTNLPVNIISDDPSSLSVTNRVMVSMGATNAPFEVFVADDADLDGTQPATILASASGYRSGSHTIAIHDNETASLALSLPQVSFEGAGTVSGAISVSAAPDQDVIVSLISNNPTEIPSTNVVIEAGQTIAFFDLVVEDDNILDGLQTATVTAYVHNWNSSSASIFVVDNENTKLTLQVPASLTEGDGVITNGGVLSIPAAALSDINALLTCSDPGTVNVPAYVTIPAGTNEVAFDILPIDDVTPEDMTTVSILADAPGYIPDSGIIIINDNDPHHFLIEGLSGDLPVSDPVPVSISARLLDGDLADVFSGPVSILASGDRGAVSVAPDVLGNAVDGVVTGQIAFGNIGNDVILVADGGGITGTSTVFNVMGSEISITPAGLTNTLVVVDTAENHPIVISNTGNADLEFYIQAAPLYTNLVINGDFEAGNSGFASDLAYTPLTNSPSKGIYTVADDSQTWNDAFSPTMKDHTTGDGQMLMANGSSTGAAVVWQQDVPVVGELVYSMSAWAANLFGEFNASLDFRVNGESIGSMTVEHLTWNEFFAQWVAPSSGTVTLSIVDTQFIPSFLPGNHFAIDDIVFLPVANPPHPDEFDEGLMASYPFSGNADDTSTNGFNGTAVGAILTADRFGNAESAYHLNGSDSYIDLGSLAGFKTVSMWIKQAERNSYQLYFYHDNFYLFANESVNGELFLSDSGGRRVSTSAFMGDHEDQWVHVVAISDGGNSRVYFNGINATVSAATLETVSTGFVYLGRWASNFYNVHGDLDDVRIYDRVLSAEEVEALYSARDSGSTTNDIFWLSAEPETGIIAPGSNMAVAVGFDAGGMMAGGYSNAMLMVTCNDVVSPTNEIPASMYAVPPALTMNAEPDATYGFSNTVSWSAVAGPVVYQCEVATDTVSAPLQQSGWQGATNHTFTALATNQIYYYRARASVESRIGRLDGPWSGWVWSTQVPASADLDADGMPDWWEQLHFGGIGIAGPLTDADGDGQTDRDEYVAGMDPNNAASCFKITDVSTPTNGYFAVYWDSVSGRVYSVQWKASMTNTFTPMATNIFYPQNSYTDDVHHAEESGFYTIEVDLDDAASGTDGSPPPPGGGGPPPPPM